MDVDRQLAKYIKAARQKHNPVFHYFYEQFGRELLDAFAPLDPNSNLDAATQTSRCSAAAGILFQEKNLPKLEYLDEITGAILSGVGKMLGALFREAAGNAPVIGPGPT